MSDIASLLDEFQKHEKYNKIESYKPYPWQLKFHNARGLGIDGPAVQKAAQCANQVGKTVCCAYEATFHATGLYPEWWKGHRFVFPSSGLVAGLTNESVRDICQSELLGDPKDPSALGSGTIPKHLIGKVTRKAGVPDAVDAVMVKHIRGGWSKISFRAYEQGWQKFMGTRIDWGWGDEEPPEEVWSQMIRGTLSTKGFLFLSFTPESGITKVVHSFMSDLKTGQALVTATWDDAPHMVGPRREQFLQQIPAHQREMRSKGIPLMGSGLVYQVREDDIKCDAIALPNHWPRLAAVDFGIGHGFAAVWCAWDRDTDTIYVYDCYKVEGEKMPVHVSKLKNNGAWIPVIWPHDGLNREKSSGDQLAELYRKEGANMFHRQFSNPPAPGEEEGNGGNSVEAGIEAILNRMNMDKLKIFAGLKPLWEEFRMYHRDNGKIVKQNDDLMDAFRYCVQSIRHAKTPTVAARKHVYAAGASNW